MNGLWPNVRACIGPRQWLGSYRIPQPPSSVSDSPFSPMRKRRVAWAACSRWKDGWHVVNTGLWTSLNCYWIAAYCTFAPPMSSILAMPTCIGRGTGHRSWNIWKTGKDVLTVFELRFLCTKIVGRWSTFISRIVYSRTATPVPVSTHLPN